MESGYNEGIWSLDFMERDLKKKEHFQIAISCKNAPNYKSYNIEEYMPRNKKKYVLYTGCTICA